MATSDKHPSLYARVGYSMELEAEALLKLGRQDPQGCRVAFTKLLMQLVLPDGRADSHHLNQLLLDILQRVNRMIQLSGGSNERCERNRVALIELFSACNTAVAARDLFLPNLDRLLDEMNHARRPLHPIVERAIACINENYDKPLSLSRIATRLAVSQNYLSRLFTKEAGMTLTAFIQRVRLRHARLLLAENERSISEIAYRVGYQNYRDFYRNFVKYENASPRQMRRRLSAGG